MRVTWNLNELFFLSSSLLIVDIFRKYDRAIMRVLSIFSDSVEKSHFSARDRAVFEDYLVTLK